MSLALPTVRAAGVEIAVLMSDGVGANARGDKALALGVTGKQLATKRDLPGISTCVKLPRWRIRISW